MLNQVPTLRWEAPSTSTGGPPIPTPPTSAAERDVALEGRREPIPFSPPSIGEDEIAEVVAALRSDWITTGPRTARFERDFSHFVGSPAALAVSSCTAALHVGLAAAGIGPGDRVITTPMTFASTVHVIEQVGAVPVLVDVEPDTLNIDPAAVARAVARERNVKAMIPVHYAGHPCDMDSLLAIAREHDLFVLEDAAHALPSLHRGERVGAVRTPGVRRAAAFSFYATKTLTTGEGGMLTGSPELVEEARVWSLHGMTRDAWNRYAQEGSWYYEVVRPGFKYNMTDVAAAMGIHQLAKADRLRRRRSEIAAAYSEGLADLEQIELPTVRPGLETSWHLYVIRLRLEQLTLGRGQFIKELNAMGIGTSVHFIPVHVHPYYRDRYGYEPNDFPVAFDAFERVVSLPIHVRMTDDDVNDVVAGVRDAVRTARR